MERDDILAREISQSGEAPDVVTLQRALGEAGRALSTSTILFHHQVARRLRLNDSDHKCLDLLLREGDMTAGELAARSGFTTGAVTGIVTRLESRDLVRRTPDPEDGRRVLVRARQEQVNTRMWPLLQPMVQRLTALHGRYQVPELMLLLDYLRQCETVMRECAAELATSGDG